MWQASREPLTLRYTGLPRDAATGREDDHERWWQRLRRGFAEKNGAREKWERKMGRTHFEKNGRKMGRTHF